MNKILDFEYTPEIAIALMILIIIAGIMFFAWLDNWETKKIEENIKDFEDNQDGWGV